MEREVQYREKPDGWARCVAARIICVFYIEASSADPDMRPDGWGIGGCRGGDGV